MTRSATKSTSDNLRRRAEDQLKQQPLAFAASPASDMDAQRLLHELQVHQIEIELQNEALHVANEKLVQAYQQLLQSEKMAAVGQLAAGVAHEINNPVGFVHSNLGTLKVYVSDLLQLLEVYRTAAGKLPADHPALVLAQKNAAGVDFDYLRDDIGKLLTESQDGLERIKRIVSDLRNFSHIDDRVWQSIDIHTCLESTLNMVWNELKYKATVAKEYAELPAITCLPAQLSQVFMNLLINAVQAIQAHGTITLRTGEEPGIIWVEVEDTGCGIPPENLSHLFDPFFTTKPVGTGTGLGLAIAYKIVETHQGHIEVRSEVGHGTTFRVILPVQQDPPEKKL
jgi:two-component system NtrC family sensor kinase